MILPNSNRFLTSTMSLKDDRDMEEAVNLRACLMQYR